MRSKELYRITHVEFQTLKTKVNNFENTVNFIMSEDGEELGDYDGNNRWSYHITSKSFERSTCDLNTLKLFSVCCIIVFLQLFI